MKQKWKITKEKGISFSQVEKGIWQFCIDHAVPIDKDTYRVHFCTTGKKDLLRRVMARATNVYKIKDEAENNKVMLKQLQHVLFLRNLHKKSKARETKINNLPKYKRNIIIGLRQLTNFLISKFIK